MFFGSSASRGYRGQPNWDQMLLNTEGEEQNRYPFSNYDYVNPYQAFDSNFAAYEDSRPSLEDLRQAMDRSIQWEWKPSEEQKKLFQEWKNYTVGHLIACPDGVNVLRLLMALRNQVGEDVPLQRMGLPSVYHFVYEMNDVVEIRSANFETRMGYSRSSLHVLIRESSVPDHSKHVRQMVLEQRKPKDESGRKIRPLRERSVPEPPFKLLVEFESGNQSRFSRAADPQRVGTERTDGYLGGFYNQLQSLNYLYPPYQSSSWITDAAERSANPLAIDQPNPFLPNPWISQNFVPQGRQMWTSEPQFLRPNSMHLFRQQGASKQNNFDFTADRWENEGTLQDMDTNKKTGRKVSRNFCTSRMNNTQTETKSSSENSPGISNESEMDISSKNSPGISNETDSSSENSPRISNQAKLNTTTTVLTGKLEKVQVTESEGGTTSSNDLDSSIEYTKSSQTFPWAKNIECETDESNSEHKILKWGIGRGRGILKTRSSMDRCGRSPTVSMGSPKASHVFDSSQPSSSRSPGMRNPLGFGRGRIFGRRLQEFLSVKNKSSAAAEEVRPSGKEELVIDSNVNCMHALDARVNSIGD